MANEAIGYLRTSSATNLGEGKDSEQRQRLAIEQCAAYSGLVIVDWFNDPAVSGSDPVETRPGFAALLTRIGGNGVRTIIVETANRFARDLMVQEIGFARLCELGVTLIAADNPQSFVSDTPTAVMVRQILGAVSQFDKTALVAKLKGARDRKKALTGKCGGRKSHAEARPEVVAIAKRLREQGLSLRGIAGELETLGHVNVNGVIYDPHSIRSMLDGS